MRTHAIQTFVHSLSMFKQGGERIYRIHRIELKMTGVNENEDASNIKTITLNGVEYVRVTPLQAMIQKLRIKFLLWRARAKSK